MKRLVLFLVLSTAIAVMAQYPLVEIADIQFRDEASLSMDDDLSLYDGDTVTIQGVVTFDPCTYALSTSGSRIGTFLADEDSEGPWSAIHVLIDPGASGYGGTLEELNEATLFIDNFQVGNVVECTGIVSSFDSHTQFILIDEPSSIIGFSSMPDPWVTTIDTFMMNDGSGGQIRQPVTGEQYESVYVEFQNVFVVDVSAFGDRWNWTLQDAEGNQITIRDVSGYFRNDTNTDDECAIWSGGSAGETATPDEFEPPTTGTYLEYVRGMIMQAFGGGTEYTVAPLTPEDVGPSLVSPPNISGITRDPVVPTSSELVTISATITDLDGTVESATIYYSFGAGSTTFSSAAMANVSGDTWEGDIPGPGTDGEYVNFYLTATDDLGNEVETPSSASPFTYQVWDDGINSIAQIQQTPFTSGTSIWSGQWLEDISVEATVMATTQTYDLSFVTIQDGTGPWSGIAIRSQPGDGTSDLNRGDIITITSAKVLEDFGFTRLDSVTFDFGSSMNPVYDPVTGLDPMDIDDQVFESAEAYEGMFIRFDDVFVTSNNADDPSTFGEWRFNATETPEEGLRVNDISYEVPFEFGTDSVVVGDPLGYIQGILMYSFSNFKLEPRDLNDIDGFSTIYPNSITAFNFPALGVNGDIDQDAQTITLEVAEGTDVSAIAPEVIFTGQYVEPDPSLEQDFSAGSVTYTSYAPVTFEARAYEVTVSFVTGIEDEDLMGLQTFPNPVNDNLTVVYEAATNVDMRIEIYSINGHKVLETSIVSSVGKNTLQLDTRGLANGLYLLQLSSPQEVATRKIEVSR